MDCRRCQGLMVEAHCTDMEGTYGFSYMKGWRCLNCGHVADAIMEANRRLQEAAIHVPTHKTSEYEREAAQLDVETYTRIAA